MSQEDLHEDIEDEPDIPTGIQPTPQTLVHWVGDQFQGDDRLEGVEIDDPGLMDEETVRVRLLVDQNTHFFLAVYEDDAMIRVGLATELEELSDSIEEAVEDSGVSLTEFVQDRMASDDDLEYEVQQFHDELYYFCSEIQYQTNQELGSHHFRDEIIYYLEGYIAALLELIE